MTTPNQPLPIGTAPELVDREFEPLLSVPFADACASHPQAAQADASRPRGRLLDRAARSSAAARVMHTARRSRIGTEQLAPGVLSRTLYAATGGAPQRPGEPLQVRLIELQAGCEWSAPATGQLREWLVVQGALTLGGLHLGLRDYHVDPAGSAALQVRSEQGAVVFVREAARPAGDEASALTVRDAEAGWPDFAPGIQRRVLWQHLGQAAMLYLAQPGAAVPLHRHGHDEECLMVQGELFLDDVLLQAGDYQLAPAGSGHTVTETDTGVVLYAHGDLDLRFVG